MKQVQAIDYGYQPGLSNSCDDLRDWSRSPKCISQSGAFTSRDPLASVKSRGPAPFACLTVCQPVFEYNARQGSPEGLSHPSRSGTADRGYLRDCDPVTWSISVLGRRVDRFGGRSSVSLACYINFGNSSSSYVRTENACQQAD